MTSTFHILDIFSWLSDYIDTAQKRQPATTEATAADAAIAAERSLPELGRTPLGPAGLLGNPLKLVGAILLTSLEYFDHLLTSLECLVYLEILIGYYICPWSLKEHPRSFPAAFGVLLEKQTDCPQLPQTPFPLKWAIKQGQLYKSILPAPPFPRLPL